MFPHGFVAKPLGEKARRFSGACPTLLTRQRWFLNGKLRLLRCGCMDWSSDKSKHANLALAKKRGKSFCCCKKAFILRIVSSAAENCTGRLVQCFGNCFAAELLLSSSK